MSSASSKEWLVLRRKVRFGDSDGARVLHFSHLLRWCHESWEESLDKYGLMAADVFPSDLSDQEIPDIALPIIHCEADFRAPIKTGDSLKIILLPRKLDYSSFEVKTIFQLNEDKVAVGLIRHLSIYVTTRKRCHLPDGISKWLEASQVSLGVRPLS